MRLRIRRVAGGWRVTGPTRGTIAELFVAWAMCLTHRDPRAVRRRRPQ